MQSIWDRSGRTRTENGELTSIFGSFFLDEYLVSESEASALGSATEVIKRIPGSFPSKLSLFVQRWSLDRE